MRRTISYACPSRYGLGAHIERSRALVDRLYPAVQSYAQLLNHGLARPIEVRILALPSGKFDMVVRNAAEMRGPQGAEQTASEHVAQPAKICVRVLSCA